MATTSWEIQNVPITLPLIVGTTTPAWLCGTFGFHPMLGFSQVKQAASIAHGCAMTLATLYQLNRQHPGNEWGFTIGSIDNDAFAAERPIALVKDDPLKEPIPGDLVVNPTYLAKLSKTERSNKANSGICWFRNEVCPFSTMGIKQTGDIFPQETKKAIMMVYELCGQTSTHTRQTN